MTVDTKALRRDTLAHCMLMAESDEAYAKWAAGDYERNPIYGGLFDGLEGRFQIDWSRAKAASAKPREAASATH